MEEAPVRELCRAGFLLLPELARVMEADEGFLSSSTVPEQYCHACRILRDERQESVPYSLIGVLFNIDKGMIKKQVKKFRDRLQLSAIIGRPILIDEAKLERLRLHVIMNYEQRCPLSIHDLCRFISSEFGLTILPKTLHHILRRDPTIKPCKAVPIDARRTEITVEQI
jgi:transposase